MGNRYTLVLLKGKMSKMPIKQQEKLLITMKVSCEWKYKVFLTVFQSQKNKHKLGIQ